MTTGLSREPGHGPDWRRLASRYDIEAMGRLFDEQACPFHGRDEAFSARRVMEAVEAADPGDETSIHTLWHCLACGACTAQARSAGESFAALVLHARRLLSAQGRSVPRLFGGALASLGRLADLSGGLRPRRLLGPDARTWPEGETIFWTGRMGLAAALFDSAQAARVRDDLVRSLGLLDQAGLGPALLDPEPVLDFESAWWGDWDTFVRRADAVAMLFEKLGPVRVVTADPVSGLLLQWVFEEHKIAVTVESFVERWERILVAQNSGNGGGFVGTGAGESLALVCEPPINLSFLATDPVLDSWNPPSLVGLVRAAGYEPIELFAEEARRRPGSASVGLRSLAVFSAGSAALCRRLLREADRVGARKVLVSDPTVWAALADVSRTGTWRRAHAAPALPGDLVSWDEEK